MPWQGRYKSPQQHSLPHGTLHKHTCSPQRARPATRRVNYGFREQSPQWCNAFIFFLHLFCRKKKKKMHSSASLHPLTCYCFTPEQTAPQLNKHLGAAAGPYRTVPAGGHVPPAPQPRRSPPQPRTVPAMLPCLLLPVLAVGLVRAHAAEPHACTPLTPAVMDNATMAGVSRDTRGS